MTHKIVHFCPFMKMNNECCSKANNINHTKKSSKCIYRDYKRCPQYKEWADRLEKAIIKLNEIQRLYGT